MTRRKLKVWIYDQWLSLDWTISLLRCKFFGHKNPGEGEDLFVGGKGWCPRCLADL